MSLRRGLCIAFALTSLAGFAGAQDQAGQDAPPRQNGGNRGQRFTDDLATRLELDAQQREQFDKIVADLRAEQAEAAPADGQGQPRRGGAGGQQFMEKLFGQVEPILRPDQVEKLNTARQDMSRRGQGMNPAQRLDQLKGELGLSPEQAATFDEAAGKLKEQWQARQNSDEQRQLMDQMREAQQSGDQTKIDELRGKMREGFTAMQQSMDSFYEEINKTLTPEQQKKLSDYRAQNQMGGNRVRLDPKQIIEVAQKLDLTAEQRAGLGEIEQQYSEQIKGGQDQAQAQAQPQRGQGGGGRGGNQVSTRLINDINQMLTDDQKKHFDQMLQRISQQRNGQNQGQGQRGQGRRGQPAGEAPAGQAQAEGNP